MKGLKTMILDVFFTTSPFLSTNGEHDNMNLAWFLDFETIFNLMHLENIVGLQPRL